MDTLIKIRREVTDKTKYSMYLHDDSLGITVLHDFGKFEFRQIEMTTNPFFRNGEVTAPPALREFASTVRGLMVFGCTLSNDGQYMMLSSDFEMFVFKMETE